LIEQHYQQLRFLQFHHLSAYPELVHGVFTRHGGTSPAPYHSLNTTHSILREKRDAVENVLQNRRLVLEALDIADSPCVTLWQIHGADVHVYEPDAPWRSDWSSASYFQPGWTPETIRKGDAIITQTRGMALTMSFADCTPLLFYDPVQHVIGIAHGGWRGTARGVTLTTIEAMQQRFGSHIEDIHAAIGPTIGECCYEVSEEVRAIFLGRANFDEDPIAERFRPLLREAASFGIVQENGRDSLRLNLQETHRRLLLLAGLRPEHIEAANICTGCNTADFFSHRKENGQTGRFPVTIMLRPA